MATGEAAERKGANVFNKLLYISKRTISDLQKEIDLWINQENSEWPPLGDTTDIRPQDSASNIGSYTSQQSVSSTTSSNTSTTSAKARAAAKKAALQAKAASLERLHELQMEELKLQQRKSKIQLQTEINIAEATRKVYEDAEVEAINPPNKRAKSKYISTNQLHEEMPPLAPEHEPIYSQTPSPREPPSGPSAPKVEPLNPNAEEWKQEFKQNSFQTLIENQDRQNQNFMQMMQQQQQGIMPLTLPQPAMEVFSGDPVDYCNFIRAFESLVEQRTTSPSAFLYYLIQYTSGCVQELMKSCLSMRSEDGYYKARRLLKERYGQNYRIASTYIKKLIDGLAIKADDGTMLQEYSVQLSSCVSTLKEIDCVSELNNSDNLKKIIDRLPYGMRLRWRDVVENIIERDNRDVTIEDVTDFVISKAGSATHPVFGKVTNDNRPRPYGDKPKRPSNPRAAGFATQTQAPRPQEERPKCSICGSNHWISRCDKFRKHTLEERQKLVKDKKLCINCLCTGHFVRTCTKESFCSRRSQVPYVNNENREQESEAARSDQPTTYQSSSSVSNGYVTSEKPQQSTPSTSVMGLAVVPVKVKARDSPKTIETYTFLDAGSNTTFCTEGLLQELNVEGKKTKLSLTTIQTKMFQRIVQPISRQVDVDRWPHLKGINVKNINADIGLLIGSDVPEALQPKEARESRNGGPFASRTILGLVLNGPLGRADNKLAHTASFIKTDEEPSRQFESFCNLEFNDMQHDNKAAMSLNDKKALKIMDETVQLKQNNYEISLLWKNLPPYLEDNKQMAEHRLNLLKRRLLRDPSTLHKYKWFIDDLTLKGYASSWPLGRIKEVYINQGYDLVRSVKLRTKSTTLVRPVTKLVLLEAADPADQE
eukprot:gene13101-14442_t